MMACLPATFLPAACSNPAEPEVECPIESEVECIVDASWAFLGLEDERIAEIAVTPWGVFVGTNDSGILRLESDGTWTQLGPEVWYDRMIVNALLYVPTDPPRLLAGVRFRHDSNDTTRAAVYASFDHGETWVPSDGGLGETAPGVWRHRIFVQALAVDPGDPQRVFMSNSHGVLRSLDAGRTWEFVLGDFNLLTNGFVDLLVDPDRTGRIWTSGQGFIFVPFVGLSDDWGQTWDGDAPKCNGGTIATIVNALALAPGTQDRLFAGADAALYRSDEGGAPGSWDCVPGTRGAVIDLAELNGALYAGTVFVERMSGPDGGVLELTELGLYRTSDGGATWDSLQVPDGAEGATEAAADPARGRLLIGTRSGLWAVTP